MLPALLLLAALFLSKEAAGLSACTANDISTQDAGCPASGPCTVTQSFTVDSGCTLDFTARPLTIAASGILAVGTGSMTIRAASLTMSPGAFVDARGASGPGTGGSVVVLTTGHVAIQRSGTVRARIDASGNVRAGTIRIDAGGGIDIGGRLLALQLTAAGEGGVVELSAAGNITSDTGSEVTATGGVSAALGGGRVEMTAGGKIDLGSEVNVTGSSGGIIRLVSNGTLTVRGLRGNATGEFGAGGSVSLSAAHDVQVLAPILLNGSDLFVEGGGEGGALGIEVGYGDLLIADDILADGAEPDGDGGEIDLFVNGAVTVASGAPISARCNGAYGLGGTIDIHATTTVTTAARIDASGGAGGGEIGMGAGGDITLTALVDARGRFEEGAGGEIVIAAGLNGSGALSVRSDVDASGGACNFFGCGEGGGVDLLACGLAVTSTGRVLARAPGFGGEVLLTARRQLSVDGTVSAARTLTSGTDGSVSLTHPSGTPPVLRAGGVAPAPQISALPVCLPAGDPACLMPCPTCGNGTIEYPEDCDDGNAAGCDGCSNFCVADVCDPAALCAVACNPQIGCPPLPPTPCAIAPTATAVATATPTHTLPPGAPTYTASSTRTVSSTPTQTPTSTSTPTRTSTPTATASPTITQTRTPTATPASRHDAVLLWPRPVSMEIKDGQPALKTLRIRVANGVVQDTTSRPVRLRVEAGDCPEGTISAGPDFDPVAGGSQDSVMLSGGKFAYAQLTLRADPLVFQPINRRSPQRCTVILQADVPLAANQDPTPDNNLALLEINVSSNSPREVAAHQTALQSASPVTLRVPRRKTSVQRKLMVVVSNADRNDVAGHAITLEASDGDCPTGTVSTPVFHRPSAIAVNNIAVGNMKLRRGSVVVRVHAADFPAGTRKSPRRCTALLVATGPSGDVDPANNVTLLPIDVVSE